MTGIVEKILEAIRKNDNFFVKFLSANDVGKTKGHQCGVLISQKAKSMLFTQAFPESGILERWVIIHWLNLNIETDSRFVYYSSKNELRITNFDKGFPFLRPDQVNCLFVLTENSYADYTAALVAEPEDITALLSKLGIIPAYKDK